MSSQVAQTLLLLVPVLPLSSALLHAHGRTRPAAALLTPWTPVPGLFVALFVPTGTSIRVESLLLGLELSLDSTAQVFLLFTALLWWLSMVFARGYLRDDDRQSSFMFFAALTMAGNLGLTVAQDLLTFYAFFALMSLTSYGLVVHSRKEAALRAGRVYIFYAIFGELALFTGFLGMVGDADSATFAAISASSAQKWPLLFAAVGLGVKVGVLGLHSWLPLAHPAAPVPASALLSGAMLKAGLLGWLRIFPAGTVGLEGWGWVILAGGLGAAFYGAAIGSLRHDPKAVLAYSSVSQMGLMTAGLGFGLAYPEWGTPARIAVILYALHHALAKAALFLGVGVIGTAGGSRRTWVLAALVLPALSLCGAPLTSGALAKSLLKDPIASVADTGPMLVIALSLAAVGTTLLMIRFIACLPHPGARDFGPDPRIAAPWVAMLAFGPVAAFVPWQVVGTTSIDLLTPDKLAVALAPIVGGFLVALVARELLRRFPGLPNTTRRWDMRAVLQTAGQRPARAFGRSAERFRLEGTEAVAESLSRSAHRLEEGLRGWSLAGLMWMSVALVLIALILRGL